LTIFLNESHESTCIHYTLIINSVCEQEISLETHMFLPNPLLTYVACLSGKRRILGDCLRKSSHVTAAREFNMDDTELHQEERIIFGVNPIYNSRML